MLLALIAIVMGSQQLLVLPNERSQYPSEGTVNDSVLPQMRFSSSMRRSDSELDEYEKQYLRSIVARLRASSHDGGPNGLLVFVLQAPIMLLSFSVVCFLAGLCSVVFAPLGKHLVWGDDAKVRSSPASTHPDNKLMLPDICRVCGSRRSLRGCFLPDLLPVAQTIQP